MSASTACHVPTSLLPKPKHTPCWLPTEVTQRRCGLGSSLPSSLTTWAGKSGAAMGMWPRNSHLSPTQWGWQGLGANLECCWGCWGAAFKLWQLAFEAFLSLSKLKAAQADLLLSALWADTRKGGRWMGSGSTCPQEISSLYPPMRSNWGSREGEEEAKEWLLLLVTGFLAGNLLGHSQRSFYLWLPPHWEQMMRPQTLLHSASVVCLCFPSCGQAPGTSLPPATEAFHQTWSSHALLSLSSPQISPN